MREMGTYTYQVNGKKYLYRHITALEPHDTITLYYIKKPRKATVGGDLGNWESPWFKFYLMISLLVAIATVIVGMLIGREYNNANSSSRNTSLRQSDGGRLFVGSISQTGKREHSQGRYSHSRCFVFPYFCPLTTILRRR